MPSAATIAAGRPRALVIAALAVALLLAGTFGLWAYFGTTVFFEIVRTGWAMCF
jgi:hypothetical protein